MDTLQQQKFEQLVLTICAHVPPDHLTTTKLNKLIWLVDKTAMCETHRTVTGVPYIRKMNGPAPEYNKVLFQGMHDRGILYVSTSPAPKRGRGRVKETYKALAAPNEHVFTTEERQLIQRVLTRYGNTSVDALVELSHDLAWAAYDDGEIIPMEAYLVSSPLLTPESPEGRKLIAEAESAYDE